MEFETLLSVLMGIGLAAAAGFRIFVPFLVVSIAGVTGNLELSENFSWIATTPALITFSVATLFEILAYYIPWFDNLLDTIASPAAVIAGAVIMVSVMADISPFIKWVLAIIAGGSVAASIQSMTTFTRAASTVTTAGVGNPVVSTAEAGGSLILSVVAIFLPLAAALVVVVLLGWTFKKVFRRYKTSDKA